MKFCRPTYRLLNKQTPELAKKTFLEHAAFYVSASLEGVMVKDAELRYSIRLRGR